MRAWRRTGPRLLRVVERLNKERALRALLALRLPFTSGKAARTGARVEVLVADAAQDPVDQSPGLLYCEHKRQNQKTPGAIPKGKDVDRPGAVDASRRAFARPINISPSLRALGGPSRAGRGRARPRLSASAARAVAAHHACATHVHACRRADDAYSAGWLDRTEGWRAAARARRAISVFNIGPSPAARSHLARGSRFVLARLGSSSSACAPRCRTGSSSQDGEPIFPCASARRLPTPDRN